MQHRQKRYQTQVLPRRPRFLQAGVQIAMLWMGLGGGSVGLAAVPTGFQDKVVATGLNNPTAMAIAPDGRVFITEQAGKLRVVKRDRLLAQPFMNISAAVDPSGERGLLGIAFDPDFVSNQWIYVYYTSKTPQIHNRVSRFTANGDVVVPGSEKILLDIQPLTGATNHNGGALHFGKDGTLFIAVGENATPENAQTLKNLKGKLLRINKDGTIPTTNPFFTETSGKNRAIWALGLRNPFTFAVQPGTGRIHINDVGQGTWEEINAGVKGANYGWP
ncbi:MAG TPA: PQQ-dependent sugar dehydrogenase, partial [Stenomitos sp.]